MVAFVTTAALRRCIKWSVLPEAERMGLGCGSVVEVPTALA